MALTKAEKKVVILLQKGEVITHDDRYFQVSEGRQNHRIQWSVWKNLQDKGLVYQQAAWPFEWRLTATGRGI